MTDPRSTAKPAPGQVLLDGAPNDRAIIDTARQHRRSGRAIDLDDLTELLCRSLGHRVPADAVAHCLSVAMAQLNGSVHPQDLPEMAFQLAMIRLATAADRNEADRGGPVASS